MLEEKVTYMTQKECRLIGKTWSSVTNQKSFGETVMLQVFSYRPSLKNLFRFRKVGLGSLRDDPRFVLHAAKLASFINATVIDLLANNEKSIVDRSLHIGHRHAQLIMVDLDPHWWAIFSSSILDCIAPKCVRNTKLALIAWHTLLSHVTEVMSFGFYAHAPTIRGRMVLPTIFEYDEFLAEKQHLTKKKSSSSFIIEMNNRIAALSESRTRVGSTNDEDRIPNSAINGANTATDTTSDSGKIKSLCFPWKFPSPKMPRRPIPPRTDPLPRKNFSRGNLKLRSLEDWDAI